jgi:NodT family efflux transporter outer membrane factor (OMF) lipoprotein
VRNLISEEQYSTQVSAADLENVKLTEQATLALTFFEIHGQDALSAVYSQTVAEDQKSLDYTRAQYETGVGTEISVVEAENTLENAQAALTGIGVARAQYEHAIAMLTGNDASTFSIPVKALNATPPAVPIGLPSQLLERRPDIAASERTMASANAQIGVATAAFYPTLTLTAAGGYESSTLLNLFSWPSRFWSVGAAASQPLFDAGLRRATVNQYIEAYNADVATYRQTVLTAFQQVEDALSALKYLQDEADVEAKAVEAAQRSLTIATAQYKAGTTDYLNVITTQSIALADEKTEVDLLTRRMTESVLLIEALGGGWDSSQLPSSKDLIAKSK